MFCPNCSNQLQDGTNFCPKCGYRTAPIAPQPVTPIPAPQMRPTQSTNPADPVLFVAKQSTYTIGMLIVTLLIGMGALLLLTAFILEEAVLLVDVSISSTVKTIIYCAVGGLFLVYIIMFGYAVSQNTICICQNSIYGTASISVFKVERFHITYPEILHMEKTMRHLTISTRAAKYTCYINQTIQAFNVIQQQINLYRQ